MDDKALTIRIDKIWGKAPSTHQNLLFYNTKVIASFESVSRIYPGWITQTLSVVRGEYLILLGIIVNCLIPGRYAIGTNGDLPIEHLISEVYLNLLNLGRVS